MKYAVIATNTNPAYAFYVPLTAAMWQAQGFTPLVLFVGTPVAWTDKRAWLALNQCFDTNAWVRFMGDFPGHRTATVAQVARLFAFHAALPADYFLTSDVDMWPVGPWVGGAPEEKAVQLYFSNAHAGDDKVHFPMCYVGARGETWHEIMKCGDAHDLKSALALCSSRPPLTAQVHKIGNEIIPLDTWNFDETYFGECLSKWPGYPSQCQFIPRDFAKAGERRLDRSGWREVDSLEGYADVHLPRPGYIDANWPSVRRVFGLVLPDKLAWADDYRARFIACS